VRQTSYSPPGGTRHSKLTLGHTDVTEVQYEPSAGLQIVRRPQYIGEVVNRSLLLRTVLCSIL
jgi:hypothetical protein